jgi:plastocyanin
VLRLTSVLVTAVVVSLLAACGGSDGVTTGSAPTPGDGAAGVSISNFKFAPATLTVKRGGRVTVTNDDSTAHTATADDGRSFDTGTLQPGDAKAVAPSKPGRYAYHCSIHPFMHGTIVVE